MKLELKLKHTEQVKMLLKMIVSVLLNKYVCALKNIAFIERILKYSKILQ